MIRKSGHRFSLATNAKRLRGDHTQTKKMERDDDSKKSHLAPDQRLKSDKRLPEADIATAMASDAQIFFQLPLARFRCMVPCNLRDNIPVPQFGRARDEIVCKLRRVVSRRYFVNRIADRSGSVANHNRPCLPTSERHSRGAEGTCAEAGGEGACAEPVGKYAGISPNIVNGIVNRSNGIGPVGFSNGEDCQA